MKILTILGARPQFIKAAAVSRELAKHQEITEVIVHTGQHYAHNMSRVFFEELKIPQPKYHIKINGGTHGVMTGRMMEKLDDVIITEEPDYVMVYGDTNSTLAGAICGKKLHKKVVHVEAGLRSYNENMPEEINRVLTDKISDILFCPTQTAVDNLRTEKITKNIVLAGDVMFDAALYYSQQADKHSDILAVNNLYNRDYILCTFHRQENTDDITALANIVAALNELAGKYRILCPLHPRTRKKIKLLRLKPSFNPIEPVGYFDMLTLLQHCKLVLTDSGGLQKEAYFFKKPCVTLREETEWVELVESGCNVLVGTDRLAIKNAVDKFQHSELNFSRDLYGDGKSAKMMVEYLLGMNNEK